ncbi:MAG: flagellar export chaperone FliS [Treponema sp.]|jgi:flagellar protein FliS|nr:flagellar export chaperone FliS [Treponema sp.]
MGYTNAYSAYQKTNVSTASQGRLVVLLYEGAAKQLTTALSYFEQNDKILPSNIEKFGIAIQKTQAIITELQVSLDMDKGGDIAKNLMALYIYFNQELINAGINKDRKKLESILTMVSQLGECWRQVSNSTANAPAAKVQSAVNIEG